MVQPAEPTDPEPIKDAVKRLAALRDELRLSAHLAGMDARVRWDEELRPLLEALEGRLSAALQRGAGEVRVQLHLGVMELREEWDALEPRLREVVDGVGRADASRVRALVAAAKDAVGRVAVKLRSGPPERP